jgi:hypothetical protein
MYHSDDEEDYGATRLRQRLGFANKNGVLKHFQAENHLMTNLLAIQEHTQKILKQKVLSELGLKSANLIGSARNLAIKKNAEKIYGSFVNDKVSNALITLFKCNDTLKTADVEDNLKDMMLARHKVEFLSEDEAVSAPPEAKAPNQEDFVKAVKNYHNMRKQAAENAKAGSISKDIIALETHLKLYPYFMDVIVIHIAANHHRKRDGNKTKEKANPSSRMIQRGYFAEVCDRVKAIVARKNPSIEERDMFNLFIFNRIVSMCDNYFKLAKNSNLPVDDLPTYICQPIDEKKTPVLTLLTSIDEGKTEFSSKMNMFLNVLENFMIDYYVTAENAPYNCRKVTIEETDDTVMIGSEPKLE